MENKNQTNNNKELIPKILKKAVIAVAGTTVTLIFFYGVTLASSKILKNLKEMGV
jgi:hypothetical protein